MNDDGVDGGDGRGKADHTPYMQFYTADWTSGTVGFTLEQRGFYFEALKMMWETKHGLPDDTKWLASALRCDVRTVRRLRSFLVANGKLLVRGGLLINPRMARELQKHHPKLRVKIAVTSPELRADFGETSGELLPDFEEIFPKTPAISMGASPIRSDQKRSDSNRSRSRSARDDFEIAVQPVESKQARPATVARFVSEDALDAVRQVAPGWDRQALLRKFMDWPGSKDARDMDKAFLGWAKKFTKGKPPT